MSEYNTTNLTPQENKKELIRMTQEDSFDCSDSSSSKESD